jgi:putative oxygen-independent coproporphyrinogen III oxidase
MSDNSSLALYIHWPFCKAKCPYCDFNSHVRESVDQEAWRKALVSELQWYAAQTQKRPLTSIFFGGGTPSLMPAATVSSLISEAERIFGFEDNIEITLEANPTSVEAERFKAYAAGGVNRLSLGIQSLTPSHLKFLGREHSAEEARAAIDLAATVFKQFSFDLIYALYDQSLDDWQNELSSALKIAGNHLSLYQLTIEEGTNFYYLHQAGKLPVLTPDESAPYFELTQQMMEAAGMPAYEISNHARIGEESRHNLTYWQGGEYIGIGPGAHGRVFLGGGYSPELRSPPRYAPRLARLEDQRLDRVRHATTNLRSPEKWLTQVLEHGHGQETSLALSSEEVQEERLLMGIRLRGGIAHAGFAWSDSLLNALENEGLIMLSPTHLIPTAKGRLVLNSLIEKLSSDSCH